MTFSRFWAPVRKRATPEEPESVAAGEPETGVLSLEQLMDSLGPANTPFDPDSTAHFSIDQLLVRREQLDARERQPSMLVEPTSALEPRAPTVLASPQQIRPAPRRISRITKLALVLLVPATVLQLVPQRPTTRAVPPVDADESPRLAAPISEPRPPVSDAKPSADPELPLPQGKHVTRERFAVDHLAAGDFAQALIDYEALAMRSPAHAAAVRILQRKLKVEQNPAP